MRESPFAPAGRASGGGAPSFSPVGAQALAAKVSIPSRSGYTRMTRTACHQSYWPALIKPMTAHDPTILPPGLPVPEDDGAAQHLPGLKLPSLLLTATDGSRVDLSRLPGRTVIYIYPRTGRPGQALPEGWDAIPGARGCTPQSCSFRDHFAELRSLGVTHLFGLSTQDSGYQREAVERLHLPFPILSDEHLLLTRALRLPTFTVSGMMLLKRMALVIEEGAIVKVFYPVFPPDQSAADVVTWLRRARPLVGNAT
jgi:peroxiredoxin